MRRRVARKIFAWRVFSCGCPVPPFRPYRARTLLRMAKRLGLEWTGSDWEGRR